MDEKTCNEKMNRVNERTDANERRINNHSDRIKVVEQEIIGMKKDTSRLEMILDKLETAIENLNGSIIALKYKPLEKYEKVAMVIVTAIVGFLIGKILV